MKANLIVYDLTKLEHYHKVLFNRTLFGFTDNSNHGSYQYKREGILSKIDHLRLLKGAIIVKMSDIHKLIPSFKKYKIKYHTYDISINPNILKKVITNVNYCFSYNLHFFKLFMKK